MKSRSYDAFSYVLIFSLLFVLVIWAPNASAQVSPHTRRLNPSSSAADIVREPTDIPSPIVDRPSSVVHVALMAREVVGVLDPSVGTTYRYWTFNGKVPGPMIRARQGDTVEITLHNDASSQMTHSVDFHAALGPGGGAVLSQTAPGQSKTFTFQATTPGLYVYHCGTPMIAEHMANGMYGLILVEPQGGLPHADREYYVMQGEIYTLEPKGKEGLQQFSAANLMDENPQYFVFNGAVDALVTQHPMPAKVGETVRVFFGNAGPNETASAHVVGEILTRVYQSGSLSSPPLIDVQTAGVPSGAAAILEFAAKKPGKFVLMDHAISRMAKGNMAVFDVTGADDAALMHSGPAGQQEAMAPSVSGITLADEANSASQGIAVPTDYSKQTHNASNSSDMTGMVQMRMESQVTVPTHKKKVSAHFQRSDKASPKMTSLNGCLTIAPDGRAILNVLESAKVYRLEAQPLLFSEHANHLVHVNGYFGSVLTVEDPRIASFVVNTVDLMAANCNVKMSAAQIQRILIKQVAATRGIVSMSDIGFSPQTLTVDVGERVVWKNTSAVTHNVMADPARAVYRVDVKLPAGGHPFGSEYMQPGQSFSHIFEVPGIYRYVCTLHEALGMKGVIIVKGPQELRAAKSKTLIER